MKNKKAVSAMVSYVLLIVIAIAISTLVYSYLKLYLPGEEVECPADTSLIAVSFSCNRHVDGTTLSVELSNRGLFNIDGVFLRFASSDRTVRQQIRDNKGNESFTPVPLTPGKSLTRTYWVGDLIDDATDDYVLEVQPAIYSDFRLIPCADAIITQPVVCKEFIPTGESCASDSECDDGFFCTNGLETCDLTTNTCIMGTTPIIDDGVSCTADSCDETNDVIIHAPTDSLCDDNSFCTGTETCDPLGATSDPITGCVIGSDPCPGQGCDEANGICTAPPECVVTGDCPAGEQCNAGTCEIIPGTCSDNALNNGEACIDVGFNCNNYIQDGPENQAPTPNPNGPCDDGIDNDCDGLIDMNDPDCQPFIP